ncbi:MULTISPECIES: hypothetical protein [Ensifer]|jgi:hypothetical protein|uniref:Uncharacterized protein n=1 Tax=Ensifer canadensis TaxID=555315 RepID=A0AAW4FF27_9HYPH|nr:MULTISPECIES: hypothetical protein [Ensifer]KQU90746.1 hypothetical protein ASD00_05180 [Ensifer sp. Root31]KQW50214.1 hypothetical protein ASD02_09700 [Ensifer sp. Root1252]KQY62974.1 hypothetical protein ASD52_12175 [Ensifer sp. Root142]KRC74438.1 hypothetical protein ASE32_05785 [Ensifer sp. Root231]KRD03151.1 hypothetical protein ASE47_19290 [Ensifer sp. Root258]
MSGIINLFLAFCVAAAASLFYSGDFKRAPFVPISRSSAGLLATTEAHGTLAPPFHFEDLDEEFSPRTPRL